MPLGKELDSKTVHLRIECFAIPSRRNQECRWSEPAEPTEPNQRCQHAQPSQGEITRQRQRAADTSRHAHDQRGASQPQPAETRTRYSYTLNTLRSETCRQSTRGRSTPLPPLSRAPIAVDYPRQGCTRVRATLRRLIGASMKIYRIFFS
ncbi:hypothetical protein ALC57_08915 [Trachymyrmex cornetzi]|uniref:Uncharacterized protein n=1 Tax=Trachymyrmex cornetzi TaxID=471704 RepID=A0A151J6A9_9HYME|nr:hypothetical protein ALC57_08915 [Trachymyrmex cornetzi]